MLAACLALAGARLVTFAPDEAMGAARYHNMVIANTSGEQRAALSDLKHRWAADCKKRGSMAIRMTLIGPAISVYNRPVSYTVASMSCTKNKGVGLSVENSGSTNKKYASWRENYNPRVLHKRKVRMSFEPFIVGDGEIDTSGVLAVMLNANKHNSLLFNDYAGIPYAAVVKTPGE
jgi:hypothetical protein